MSNDTKRKIDIWIGRLLIGSCATVVGLTGWAARDMLSTVRLHTAQMQDFDRRLTRREETGFTQRDASALSTSVARLALLNTALSKDLEQLSTQLANTRQELQMLREAMIRNGTPVGTP